MKKFLKRILEGELSPRLSVKRFIDLYSYGEEGVKARDRVADK